MAGLRVKFVSGYDDEGYDVYEWGRIDGYVNINAGTGIPIDNICAIIATDDGKLKPVYLDKIKIYE
jgi:hypothetical protein